ncbi:hypothetical protein JXO52_06205 [bacterium]|nr:hypothetical protein [bacterium]
MNSSRLQLYRAEFSCPQCGAPAVLDETEYAINCPFCRTGVLLVPERFFRNYFPAAVDGDLIYVPYWRLRGAYFRIHDEDGEVKRLTKFIDTTILGVSLPHLPYSLGIRTQNLTLKPVCDDLPGTFLSPDIALEEVRERVARVQVSGRQFSKSVEDLHTSSREFLEQQESQNVSSYEYYSNFNASLDAEAELIDLISTAAVDLFRKKKESRRKLELEKTKIEIKTTAEKRVDYQEFIGEIISLLHYPVTVRDGVLRDGVLDEQLSRTKGMDTILSEKQAVSVRKTWKSLPLTCPGCGWTLEGASDSILFTCSNCDTRWLFHDKKLRRCRVLHLEPEEKHGVYLPYWKLKIRCPGFEETVYENQIKRNFVWRGRGKDAPQLETEIWTPALRLLPDEFLIAATKINAHAGNLELKKGMPASTALFPVTLPVSEAVESLTLILYEMTGNKSRLAPDLPDLEITASEARVVYVPFQKQAVDLVQPRAHFAIRHAAIRDRTGVGDVMN